MKVKLFTIPNLITSGNLFCGAMAIVQALAWGNLTAACWWIVAAAVCDFFDGFAARLLDEVGPMGIQLDSLADDISFGLAPAATLYTLYTRGSWTLCSPAPGVQTAAGCALFLFAVCAALRLAKFNVDGTRRNDFCGLPSPAAALLCVSLGWLSERQGWQLSCEAVLAVAACTAALMVSTMRMFTLKFHGFGWAGNQVRYLFLAVAAVAAVLLGVRAIPVLIPLYVAASAVRNLLCPAREEDSGKRGGKKRR